MASIGGWGLPRTSLLASERELHTFHDGAGTFIDVKMG